MAEYLTLWWVWVCGALVLGVIELLVPAIFFLGFALGALAMALIVFIMPLSNVPLMFALFAILSLISWFALKQLFKRQSSGARVVLNDINEN